MPQKIVPQGLTETKKGKGGIKSVPFPLNINNSGAEEEKLSKCGKSPSCHLRKIDYEYSKLKLPPETRSGGDSGLAKCSPAVSPSS